MGFIKAFTGALGGTLADEWKDFLTPPNTVEPTAAIFPAVARGQDAGRGSNTKGSEHIITNGSKIVVPEGYGLMTFQDGALTGFVGEPGGFIWHSDDQNSQSFFAGDGLFSSTLKTSWERFKFGGQPGSEQLAFYVNLKEIPNNRFGTQSQIYWDDAYLGTQVGAITRGTYTLQVIDPILLVKQFVPVTYYGRAPQVFDFSDFDNDAASQLFNEVVGSLAQAFSHYTNDPSKGNRIAGIQGDSVGFAQSLSHAVEEGYQWTSDRGLTIVKVALQAIEYDEDTRELLSDVKKADALAGRRGNSFMQQSAARGLQAAGETGGGSGMAFMGMGMGAAGGAMQGLQQPTYQQPPPPPGYGYPPQQGYGQQGYQQGPPRGYQQGPPPGYGYPPQQGYQQGPPQGYQQGYPPPPQGYQGQQAHGQQPGQAPGQQAPRGGAPQGGQQQPRHPQQPGQQAQPQQQAASGGADPVAKLAQYKEMLDQGLISQDDYDAAKAKALGL